MTSRLSVAGCALFAGLAGVSFNGCSKQEAAVAAPPEVLVMPAATRDVPVYREWIGTIDGSENAEIRARVTGYLIKRDYDEGSLVKKERSSFRDRSATL